jgi:6-phosphogluconate dehydrogenase
MLLVPAGKPVDTAIESLPYLDKGDILIDGGNTYFTILTADLQHYRPKEIHFFWNGYLRRRKGARFGPSLMPGGNKEAYEGYAYL